MPKILIIDDEPVVREPIAAILRTHGHEVLSVGSGAEGLETAHTRAPDLIVLDILMPGMDGLTVLRQLRAAAATGRTPVLLMSSESDKGVIVQAAKLGAQGYLLKTRFSITDLLERIQRLVPETGPSAVPPPVAMAAEPAPPAPAPGEAEPTATAARPSAPAAPLLTRETCLWRIRQALGGKSLGGIVAQVIAMAASPHASMSDLAALIARDPVLAARVLHVANSPAFATRGKMIITLADAVRQIGCGAVRDAAATLGIFNAVPRQRDDHFNPLRRRQHALTVAHLCQHLAASGSRGQEGVAYLVGLCHDLGEILLHSYFEEELGQVLRVQAQSEVPLALLERQMLGVRREDLAELLFEHLGLPAAIRVPIAQFHDRAHAGYGELTEPLARILRLADRYANGMMLSLDARALVDSISCAEARLAVGQDHPLAPDHALLRGKMGLLTGMLAHVPPELAASLLAPPCRSTSAQVCFVRHPAMSAWDPVAAAIQGLSAGLVLLDHLPEPDEYQSATHILIESPAPGTRDFDAPAVARLRQEVRRPVIWLVAHGEEPATVSDGAPLALPVTLEGLAHLLAPDSPAALA